ncbi:MAG: SH3 domain-containing protein [Geminicoccaceae bacterium]
MVSAGTSLAAPADSWLISGDNVNLRRGPTTSAEIKRQLSDGQLVIERSRQGEWFEVEIAGTNGLLGWIHQSLLREASLVAPASQPIATRQPALKRRQPELAVRKAASLKPKATFVAPDEDAVIEEMLTYVKRRKKLPKEPEKSRVGQSGREIIGPVPIRKPGDQSRVPTELVLASSDVEGIVDAEAMETFRDSVSYLNNRAWSVAGIKLFSEIEPVGGGVVQVKTTDDWFEVPEIGQKSYLNTLLDRWFSAKADGGPAGIMLVDAKGDLLMHQTRP